MASSSTTMPNVPQQSADPVEMSTVPAATSTPVSRAARTDPATRTSGLLDSTAIPSSSLAMDGSTFTTSSPLAEASKEAATGGVPATILDHETKEHLAGDDAPVQDSEDTGAITNAAPITLVETEAGGPTIHINLLLTTGARHPYRITNKYLQKRQVQAEGNDPFNISVYTLKELIWREWREEWETRPLSPTAIRLIHFGRLLDDKVPIKDCRFSYDGPNVVHLTVKPQDLIDEELTQKGKRVAADGEDAEGGGPCRCIIL